MLWNEYLIKIRSIPKLNEFALANIIDYIQMNYGYNKRDVRARVINNISKGKKRYMKKLKKYKEELRKNK